MDVIEEEELELKFLGKFTKKKNLGGGGGGRFGRGGFGLGGSGWM